MKRAKLRQHTPSARRRIRLVRLVTTRIGKARLAYELQLQALLRRPIAGEETVTVVGVTKADLLPPRHGLISVTAIP